MEQKPYLEKNDVQAVIDFAQAMWSAERGYYSPYLQNQLLNDLNNTPKVPTMETLRRSLANYKEKAEDLQDYMQFMSKWDMIFARTLDSYTNMLSFDLQLVCKNAFTKQEYQSEEYRQDKNKIYKFLDSFDYKKEFQKCVKQVMTSEVGYYWFRRTRWGRKDARYVLQLMPQRYCKITGYYERGILWDFDMNYFLNPSVDIDGFDPVFKRYFNETFVDENGKLDYRPSASLNERNGKYAMWHQTSPEDGAFCVKLDTSNFNETPYLAPLLKSSLRNDEIEKLQYNKDIASAYAILSGEIRLFNNSKSGTVANQFAIQPKTMGAFMSKVKSGLGDVCKAVAMPTENTDFYQFVDNNKDMYDRQLAVNAGQGSGIGRLIYSSDKLSNAELQYSVEVQYALMKTLYPQFQDFLEFWANKLTNKYKFKFIFEGCNYQFDRDKRIDRVTKYADRGIVLNTSAFASAIGMTPQDFDRSLMEASSGEMADKLSMLLNINTMKDGGDVGGRPQKEGSKLTDSGQSSRESLDNE